MPDTAANRRSKTRSPTPSDEEVPDFNPPSGDECGGDSEDDEKADSSMVSNEEQIISDHSRSHPVFEASHTTSDRLRSRAPAVIEQEIKT